MNLAAAPAIAVREFLKDKSLEDSENLPKPDVPAHEIAGDLRTALEQVAAIAAELKR